MARYERGDVVRVNLNPTAGREIQGDFRPALVGVASPDECAWYGNHRADNARRRLLSLPLIFAVSLTGTGMGTQGVALVNMIRTVDLDARKAKKIERAPQYVIDDACQTASDF